MGVPWQSARAVQEYGIPELKVKDRYRVKIVVRGSPYKAVVSGRRGTVTNRIRIGTPTEQVTVLFDDGSSWNFYPDELRRISGEAL